MEKLKIKFSHPMYSGRNGGTRYFVVGDLSKKAFYYDGTEEGCKKFRSKYPDFKIYEVWDHSIQHEINN